MLTPGQKIFEYEVVRQLGQGGFAAVFEAVDRLLNRRVAIKQLLPNKVGEKVVKRFIQEARVAAALEHPNIITIYGLRISNQRIYIIMEYLPGGSLQELLKRKGKLPVEQALKLAIGICEGLGRLHDKGIIHRDIKAENILLTADGRPKVTDFGIAHMPEAVGGLGLTLAGFQPRTLLFSSPEQLRGEGLDARSDVYQLGELLYYMLTGEHYINLEALEAQAEAQADPQVGVQLKVLELLEQAICYKMPEGLQTLWQEVGTLASLVEKALEKDKDQRFADALEFATALQAVSVNTAPPVAQDEKQKRLDSWAYNRRGLSHASMRNYEQAIYDYTQAIQLDRHYAEAYNNRSAAHLLMENYAQAVLDCNWAIELAPHFIAAYVNRGIANTGLRQYEEALFDYNKVIELNDQSVYAYYNRGNTYMWMGEHQKALADYSRVIKLNPEFLAAYVNRGAVYDLLGQWEKAAEDYSRAISLNAGYVYAYYNRAHAYQALGHYEQAVADYTKVIELNPEHPYAYENRAKAYAQLGQGERAAQDEIRITVRMPTINPRQLTVARSMLMPATPLDLLTRRENGVA